MGNFYIRLPLKMNIKEVAMPVFIDYLRSYRKLGKHSGSISIWAFVLMIFVRMRFDFDTAFACIKMV